MSYLCGVVSCAQQLFIYEYSWRTKLYVIVQPRLACTWTHSMNRGWRRYVIWRHMSVHPRLKLNLRPRNQSL